MFCNLPRGSWFSIGDNFFNRNHLQNNQALHVSNVLNTPINIDNLHLPNCLALKIRMKVKLWHKDQSPHQRIYATLRLSQRSDPNNFVEIVYSCYKQDAHPSIENEFEYILPYTCNTTDAQKDLILDIYNFESLYEVRNLIQGTGDFKLYITGYVSKPTSNLINLW